MGLTKKLLLHIDEPTYELLRANKRVSGMPVSEFIRRAIAAAIVRKMNALNTLETAARDVVRQRGDGLAIRK